MTIDQAVEVIRRHVVKTGMPAAEAVRACWDKIQPLEDPISLIQAGLATLVSVAYRRPDLEIVPGSPANGTRTKTLSVRHERGESREYTVSVTLLDEIHYRVGEKVLAVSAMGRSDLLTLAENAKAQADGWTKSKKAFEFTAERLLALRKTKVSDLAEGERIKLARMFAGLHNRETPSEIRA